MFRINLLLLVVVCLFTQLTAEAYAQRQEGFALGRTIWPRTALAVCWENPENWKTETEWVKQAISRTWEQHSALTFSGWGNCHGISHRDLIRIRIHDGVWQCGGPSAGPHACGLGKTLDNKPNGMVLNFSFQNWNQSCQRNRKFCIEAIAIHEFGHGLGFAHEHNRADRPASCKEPAQGTDGDVMVGDYDPISVMNYCAGYRTNLSPTDIRTVQTFYGTAQQIQASTPKLFATNGSQLRAIWSDGRWITLGKAAWTNTTSLTNLGDRLFAIQNCRLHEVNLKNGIWWVRGQPVWCGPSKMVGIDNQLFVVQNKRLHQVDPKNGSYVVLGGANWDGTTSMARLDSRLFIVKNNHVHEVDKNTGTWKVLGKSNWGGPTSMVGFRDSLYIIQNAYLHKFNPNNGTHIVLSNSQPVWGGETSMASGNGELFAIQNNRLHLVDPNTGTWRVLGGLHWNGQSTMAFAGN